MRRIAIPLALVSAAAVLATVALRPLPLLAPLAWMGFLWLPGFLFADGRRFGAPRTAWVEAGYALVLGPAVAGMAVSAALLLGASLGLAVTLPPLLGIGGWIFAARRRPEAETMSPVGWPVLLVAFAILLVGSFPAVLHAPMRLNADALLHLPVVQRVLAGSFPPENPFLAGEPFTYFWVYHALLGGIVRATGIDPDWVGSLLNVHALAALLFVIDATGRRLGLGVLPRVLALVVFAFGLCPLAWVEPLRLRLAHPETNWAAVWASGSSAWFPLLSYGEPRLAAALTKIAVTNPLPLGLALGLVGVMPPRGTRVDQVRRAFALFGVGLMHLPVGLLFLGGAAVRHLVALQVAPPGERRRHGLAFLGTVVVGLLLVPYAMAVLGPRSTGASPQLGFVGDRVLALHLSLAAVWILSAAGGWAWLRERARVGHLVVGLPALALTLFVTLIDGNEYKGTYVLLVLLAPAAGLGLSRLVRGNAWLAGLAATLLLPGSLIALTVYAEETPPAAAPPSLRADLREASRHLPADAVVWKFDPGRFYSSTTFDLGTPCYASDPYANFILGQWDGSEARFRRKTLEAARSGQVILALTEAAARVAPRPLMILLTSDDSSRFSREVGRILAADPPVLYRGPTVTLLGPAPTAPRTPLAPPEGDSSPARTPARKKTGR